MLHLSGVAMTVNTSGALNDDGALQGTVERIRFAAEETGWCCLSVRAGDRRIHTVVGLAPGISVGERVQCRGRWQDHARYGRQFAADTIVATPPATSAAIERYLASGAVDGIGRTYAARLVEAFGDRLIEVLDREPASLERVPGIGPARRRRITASWRRHREHRESLMFLRQCGLGPRRAANVYRRYRERAVRLVREDPYRLAEDVAGIGFSLADTVASRVGFRADHPVRVAAGLRHTLLAHRQTGDCAVPRAELLAETGELLSLPAPALEAGLERALARRRLAADVVDGSAWIYLPALLRAELALARALKRLASSRLPWGGIDPARALVTAERRVGLTLSPSQRAALERLLDHKLGIVTGGPGSGKTTIARVLTDIFLRRSLEVALCAPTGRAARRLSEATGHPAMTVHRLLGGAPGARGFLRNARSPLAADVLLIDEWSMGDLHLTRALLDAAPTRCAVIVIGDAAQLPSIGPGKVLVDMIASRCIETVRLTEIHRQAAGSGISASANRIVSGHMPIMSQRPDDEFHFVAAPGGERIAELIEELVCRALPARYDFDPLTDIQVLTPMRRGPLGAVALSERLQRRLTRRGQERVRHRHGYFAVGDRVVQQANNYDKGVYNGDTGRIERLGPAKGGLTVAFDAARIAYGASEVGQLALAHAMTVHKAQGSEYRCVVMPVAWEHFVMLERRLLYTAVTRARERVVLVGERRALRIAVGRGAGVERRTALALRIRRAFGV